MKKSLIVCLFAALLIFVGCSNNESKKENSSTESKQNETETIRLVDDLGNEVNIPASPELIIAPYLEDDLLTIDMMPITQWSLNDGDSIQDYLQNDLKDVPLIPFDLPFEVVTEHQPDLIILNSAGLAEGDKYNTYSKIAPTFVIETEKHEDWRERLEKVAEIFGKEDIAKEKLSEYDEYAEEKKKLIKNKVENESAIALWWTQDSFFMVNERKSSGAVLYNDLELTPPNLISEQTVTEEDNWLPVSLESLAELDADHIFLIVNQEGDGSEAFNESVFHHIPAVENDNVYEVAMEKSWLYSGNIANIQIIDDVVDSLVQTE